MKRWISKYDEDSYTYMFNIINSIGGRKLKYNWLITNIEAYPSNEDIADKLDEEYVFLSNDELLDILEEEDFQWIWASLSAIPNNIDKDDVLQYSLPSTDKVELDYKSKVTIQHPLAYIEIDCIDSSYFSIIFRDDSIENNFLKAYPKSIESIDSPEDYFTSYDDIITSPTFEFSYHPFSKDKNILSVFKKRNYTARFEDSLYISEEYFDDFIRKYPFFDKISLKNCKDGTFNYFGPDNYYDKNKTKEILNKLKSQITDHNKKIIKFLEKAINEHNGFYIHGI